jgi:hypothetical protein
VKNRGSVKVTTRCIVVPPSPINPTSADAVDFKVDNNNNSPSPQQQQLQELDTDSLFNVECHQQPPDSCASSDNNSTSGTESYYARNRSTTRSWPVIYRNNSLHNNYLEPNPTKTEQLQSRNEQHKRKSTHQYDFDQINANYQQYLASHRKSSNFDTSTCYDKSPSIYDMQQYNSSTASNNQSSSERAQNGNFCNVPPTIALLFVTLIMTTSATSMLCAAFLTDHWENLYWDRDALINIVNQTELSSKVTNRLEFLIDEKVARLPLKNGKGGKQYFFSHKRTIFPSFLVYSVKKEYFTILLWLIFLFILFSILLNFSPVYGYEVLH